MDFTAIMKHLMEWGFWLAFAGMYGALVALGAMFLGLALAGCVAFAGVALQLAGFALWFAARVLGWGFLCLALPLMEASEKWNVFSDARMKHEDFRKAFSEFRLDWERKWETKHADLLRERRTR